MSTSPQGPFLLADHPVLHAGITAAFNAGVAEGPFAILDRAGPSPESVAFWFGPAAEPVAFATMLDAGANTAWLDLLWVHPEHRRQGMASQLVAAACQASGADGASKLLTGVAIDNAPMAAVVQKMGFTSAVVVFGRALT